MITVLAAVSHSWTNHGQKKRRNWTVVGGLRVDNQICVGDPGLTKKDWITVQIAPGLYQCNVFLASADGTEDHSTVTQMSILSMDKKPKQKPQINTIGKISVDFGVAGFLLPDITDGRKAASKIMGNTKTIIDEKSGFISLSGHGDGTYPVITFTNEEGEIEGITVRFM